MYWFQSDTYAPTVFGSAIAARQWAETAVGDTSARFGAELTFAVVERTKQIVYSVWTPWYAPVPETPEEEQEAPVE